MMVAGPNVSTDPVKTLATTDNVVDKTVWPRYGAAGTVEVSITQRRPGTSAQIILPQSATVRWVEDGDGVPLNGW